MKHLAIGVLLGSLFTGSLVGADSFYNSDGSLNAPRGSQKYYDYNRQRQAQSDLNRMRRQADQDRLRQLSDPCR